MQNILSNQQFIITSVVFLAASGGFAGLTIQDRRPRESLNTPMLPATPLMLVCGLVALLALAHLFNLLGLHR